MIAARSWSLKFEVDTTAGMKIGLPSGATVQEVRAAFYRMSHDLHPDRYHRMDNRELRDRLESIYARMCEGYRVLTTAEKRTAYMRALGEGRKRLNSTDREARGQALFRAFS